MSEIPDPSPTATQSLVEAHSDQSRAYARWQQHQEDDRKNLLRPTVDDKLSALYVCLIDTLALIAHPNSPDRSLKIRDLVVVLSDVMDKETRK